MFARENVAEAGDGKFVGNFHATIEEDIRSTDGNEVIDGLYRSGLSFFLEKMFRGLGPLGDGGAGVENQRGILLDSVFAQRTSIPLLPRDGARGKTRSGKKGDALVAEVDQVLRHAKGRLVAESLHVDKVGAKLSQRPHDDGRDAALPEFAIGVDLRFHAVDRRKKNAIDPTRDQVLQNGLLALRLIPRMVQD